jgi:DnaK suppressor protein
MKKEERTALKSRIIEKIEETENKINALEEATQPISPENAIGRVSRMDAINNKSVSEAALRIAKKQLSSLQLALSKIDKPEFGICSNCKRPIQSARLMFMPQSSRCVRCADGGR